MKATQLEQMKEDYSYIMKTKNMTQNSVGKHKEVNIVIITLACFKVYVIELEQWLGRSDSGNNV